MHHQLVPKQPQTLAVPILRKLELLLPPRLYPVFATIIEADLPAQLSPKLLDFLSALQKTKTAYTMSQKLNMSSLLHIWETVEVRGIGGVSYEIYFNHYFYQYEPPWPLREFEAEILEGVL